MTLLTITSQYRQTYQLTLSLLLNQSRKSQLSHSQLPKLNNQSLRQVKNQLQSQKKKKLRLLSYLRTHSKRIQELMKLLLQLLPLSQLQVQQDLLNLSKIFQFPLLDNKSDLRQLAQLDSQSQGQLQFLRLLLLPLLDQYLWLQNQMEQYLSLLIQLLELLLPFHRLEEEDNEIKQLIMFLSRSPYR